MKNGKFDKTTKIFTIENSVENDQNENSIILAFETLENIENTVLLSPSSDCCSVTISPNLPPSNITYSEFVFVVDCSGSMVGKSIEKASECLEIFIKSLPLNSFFNVVLFGSKFVELFEKSIEYKDEFVEKAIDVARNLKADLGGTVIFNPLKKIFSEEVLHGQRQIFIMTDGEVMNVEKVLRLISRYSNNNRCFTIGIGRGCDAGLVEGMANSSGGKNDFVQEGDSISEKAIPQLQSSLHPSLNLIEIHIENNESFKVSPFPIPAINPKGSSVVYLSSKNSLNGAVLINGVYDDESIEIPINEINKLEEDKFGCSGGKNIGNAIFPLYAFNIIRFLD